jgi:HEPN domain-containing protein
MSVETKVAYWMELAEYDFGTAQAMLNTERYLYVGFMAHQSVEKSLKALCWKRTESEPPYTHDLWKLARQAGVDTAFDDEQSDFLDDLAPLNIEARYPKFKDKLLVSLTHEFCVALIDRTEGMMTWIKKQL